MHSLDALDWEILNATADDWENLEQIYLGVCFEYVPDKNPAGAAGNGYRYLRVKPTVLLEEVADRVRRLVETGLLTAVRDEDGRPVHSLSDLSYVWRAWFAMSPQGRSLWETSDHFAEPGPVPPPSDGRPNAGRGNQQLQQPASGSTLGKRALDHGPPENDLAAQGNEPPDKATDWPADVADLYREIGAEDRRLAEQMFPGIRQTWPPDEMPS